MFQVTFLLYCLMLLSSNETFGFLRTTKTILASFQLKSLSPVKSLNRFQRDREIASSSTLLFDNTNKETFPPSSSPSSPRRINPNRLKKFANRLIFSVISIFFLGIAANFLNITSLLLSNTSPEYFRSIKFDELYSIEGFRRYEDERSTYQFIFPDSWRIDTKLLQKRVQLNEMPKELMQSRGLNNEALPEIAYGRPEIKFKENLSVIKRKLSPARQEFLNSLQQQNTFQEEGSVKGEGINRPIDQLYQQVGKQSSSFSLPLPSGDVSKEVAEDILQTVIAPEGSGKKYEFVTAQFEKRADKPYFVFEYRLEKDIAPVPINQHTISVITIKNNYLYTFTVTAPEQSWESDKASLSKIAESFVVN